MDYFQKIFNSWQEPAITLPHLHQLVMARVRHQRMRYLLVLMPISITMFMISLWQLWETLISTHAYEVVQDMFANDMTISLDFARECLATLYDIGSLYAAIFFVMSVLMMAVGLIIYMKNTLYPSWKSNAYA